MLRNKVRTVLESAHRRVKRSILAGGPQQPAGAVRTGKPLVSVVIPTYNVEAYLDACLGSITTQTYQDLEIIVVDDGSSDRTLAIAGSTANHDPRIRVISQANSGPAVARNRGASLARGTYLTFVDADDLLPSTAIENMVTASEASGSDVIVGAIERLRNGRTFKPDWAQLVHECDHLGVRIDEYPMVLRNFYTGSKMFRRSFWTTHEFGYREGTLFEDQPLITEALCRARAVDVLSAVTYTWRLRDDGSSRSQAMYTATYVEHRKQAIELTRAVIDRVHSPEVRDAWLWTLLEAHFPGYLRQSLRMNRETYAKIVDMIAGVVSTRDLKRVTGVSAQNRVLLQLALTSPKSVVEKFLLDRGYDLRHQLIRAKQGKVYAELPTPEDGGAIPESFYELDPNQMRLSATVRSVSWMSPTELQVAGWAYITNTPMTLDNSTITIDLINTVTGEQVTARVERVAEPGATVEAGSRFNSYDAAGFIAHIQMDDVARTFAAESGVVGSWRFQAHVAVAGISRSGVFTRRSPNSSATHLRSARVSDSVYARPGWSTDYGLSIKFARRPFSVSGVTTGPESTVINFRRNYGTTEPSMVRAVRDASSRSVSMSLIEKDHDEWAAVIEHDEIDRGPWLFQIVDKKRKRRNLHVSDLELGLALSPYSSARVAATDGDQLQLSIGSAACRVDTFEATDRGTLVLTGAVLDPEVDMIRLVLSNRRAASETAAAEVNEGTFRVEVSLAFTEWGRSAPSLPTGFYRVAVEGVLATGKLVRLEVVLGRGLFDAMPVDAMGPNAFARLYIDSRGACNVQVLTPLAHNERSRFALEQMVARYRADDRDVEDGIYYQCLEGSAANDSQLAVFKWFRAHRPTTPQYWGVCDYSVPVPQSATPVLINSPRWFEILAGVKFVCVNHELPGFFVPKNGQIVVQTYHGHPFKSMGVVRWRELGAAEAEIDENVVRRNAWDILSSPSPDATRMYRENFPVRAEIAEVGHPRNDALVTDLHEMRSTARSELGLAEDEIAVLYAPTYRDLMGTPWESKLADFLNPVNLQAALGDRFVVLMRGHASNLRYATRRGQSLVLGQEPGVIDVSSYPDVNDLIAASDLGVFDYSSIRFDYAVTGKPMFFFVPDRKDYFEHLHPLLDYDETTPGPQVASLHELRERILDIDGYWKTFQKGYDKFRARFNPYDDGKAAARLAAAMVDYAEGKVARNR